MAINLNHSIYGAQFNAFRALASQAGLTQDTLVSVDEAASGKGLLNESGESRKIVVKNGDTIRPPPGKIRSAKSLAKALDGFRREAAEKYAEELLKPNDSELMTKIKQNLLMSLALAQGGAAAGSLAEEIDDHGDDLAAKYGMQNLLTAIAPGLKSDKSA